MFIKFHAPNRTKVIALLVVAAFFAAAPLLFPPYLFYILTLLVVNFIVMVSFRFVGLMGGWPFVWVGFWGLGGYATGLFTTKLGLPFGAGILVAGFVTAVCGLVIGIPCLKTRGTYFILATFAAFEAIRQMWIRLRFPFGGNAGLHDIPTPAAVPYYYLVLGLTGLSVAIMYCIEFSRVGDAIKSVAANELLAESVGIHAWRYRIMALVIGSFFVGLAGALYAHTVGVTTPTDFTFFTLLTVIVAALLGGIGTVFGPMIGISVITAINYLGRHLLEWLPLVYGCILIAVILFLPRGLESLPQRISAWRQGYRVGRLLTEERKWLIKKLFNK